MSRVPAVLIFALCSALIPLAESSILGGPPMLAQRLTWPVCEPPPVLSEKNRQHEA